jgi:hypothetical protein
MSKTIGEWGLYVNDAGKVTCDGGCVSDGDFIDEYLAGRRHTVDELLDALQEHINQYHEEE